MRVQRRDMGRLHLANRLDRRHRLRRGAVIGSLPVARLGWGGGADAHKRRGDGDHAERNNRPPLVGNRRETPPDARRWHLLMGAGDDRRGKHDQGAAYRHDHSKA